MKKLPIVAKDPWLEPCEGELLYRHSLYSQRLANIEKVSGSIINFANGYLYFGFQRDEAARGWWFREWLPGAKDVYLFGDFNGWQRTEMPLRKGLNGEWSIFFSDEEFDNRLIHGSLVKLLVHGENGWLERIPAYIRRVVQNEETKNFSAQFWNPPLFDWGSDNFKVERDAPLFIYECHVGMAQEKEAVGTYREFEDNILPRIKDLGYNAIQMMAIAEHPYYGSFGYHVSSFFAPSSRFGTPEELKSLVRKAHSMGIAVIMDIVHAHYVKNINEGINELDGTDHHYSVRGEAGDQPYWDSKLFDYGKGEVVHFLLSNLKYWMDEFRFDGFRFDGVTSMVYYHHGYTEFDDRDKYFNNDVNRDALCYLTLANKLVHDFRADGLTIAEDVSGMPGMAEPIDDGGVGFDYRLGMAIPDFWIKLLKDIPDQDWDIYQMWNIMINRLPGVKTVAYAESHDQAMVGDQTIAFRLIGKDMYTSMSCVDDNLIVARGIALHKMIRLFTLTLGGQAYLNFMGNEFGHPEWIDFPREGNHWSYSYAMRHWSLSIDKKLKYSSLQHFDRLMIDFAKKYNVLGRGYAYNLQMDQPNQTIVFSHGDLVFVFNWHPQHSSLDYPIKVLDPGKYRIIFSTDERRFAGGATQNMQTDHFTFPVTSSDGDVTHHMQIYNVCRTASVYKKM